MDNPRYRQDGERKNKNNDSSFGPDGFFAVSRTVRARALAVIS
jgi:hypothetical protein